MTEGTAEPRPWGRAALWLAGLGMLFFSSYNAANWLASQRANVPSIVFGWESSIPYWPWTIVPYWSIDLFYCISLFICATRRELDTHARRLLAVQLISVTIFVLAPLRCTFTRAETTGVFGAMLDALLLFDKPFNHAPALHISLLVILWVCYAKHLNGLWRWLLHGWFALIAVSVLTTYQHHFFDIPTGAWAGLFCIWLFPDDAKPPLGTATLTRDPQRRRLALRYFAVAIALAAAAIAIGGWALWLLWIAGALLLVSLVYACLDVTAFQKNPDGRMTLASRLLFAPYLAGAWLNSRWWTRHAPAASAITPQVWIGRMPGHAHDLPANVQGLVDLCAELPCPASTRHYLHLPRLDLVPLTAQQLAEAAQGISCLLAAGPVLVCCALGYSRSAASIAAWLILSGKAATADEAMASIAARARVVFSGAQRVALEQLAREQKAAP
jgi:protein-tyrosine phosphatase